ncbi:acyltransferase [Aquabacterium sp.]|uniref:acyltransferase family protein n=1 Tax=Aquabacterium sp. TaxID=1872578 RepID=UPI002E2F91CA|nr:acyltransferase [Aquabacterium sp.]HEX5313143.1 acyltransferase [Aquabacterium sp.]
MNKPGNIFDIVRLLSALMVIFSHHYPLSARPEPAFMNVISYGGLAVIIFFGISGYLITASRVQTRSTMLFLEKRVRRIFPGLIFCAAITYFIAIPLIEGKLPGSANFVAFVRSAMMFVTTDMGIARDFKYPNSINGSLWTLSLEFTCYIVVALFISHANIKKSLSILTPLTLCACIYSINSPFKIGFYGVSLQALLPLLLSFLTGAVVYQLRDSLIANTRLKVATVAVSVALLVAMNQTFELQLLIYVLIPIISILISMSFTDKIINRRFDISYGVYIYAFPTQQLIINHTNLNFTKSMLASMACTIVLAAFSWKFVESRFLKTRPTPLNG